MVKIDLPQETKTAKAIYQLHTETAKDWRRDHLGASQIGKECANALWLGWRWAIAPEHEGRILRLFERGNREEDELIREFKALGVEFVEQENGEQWLVSYHGGHFGGSGDGVGRNFPEAAKTWHLFEAKTASLKSFNELDKLLSYERWNPAYWTQVHVYMHGLKLKRALVVVVCKNDDRIYTERIHYDASVAEAAIAKAEGVVFSPEPMTKISDDPSFFKCKFCDAAPICHGREYRKLERNCRTCVSSTPMPDGTWKCEHLDAELSSEAQRQGCTEHLMIPQLVGLPVLEVFEKERVIVYDRGGKDRLRDERGEFREVKAL